MRKFSYSLCLAILFFGTTRFSLGQPVTEKKTVQADDAFKSFEIKFLDAYWKQYPSAAIAVGYGKYYDHLVIPDQASFENNVIFSKHWIELLHGMPFASLNDNYKISYRIIDNQLRSDCWYTDTLKPQQWDPSMYNLSGESYNILTQPYAPLDTRLRILSSHLANADAYYKAAFKNIFRPTREHTDLAIRQNEGGLEVFGQDLTDSINASHLNKTEKDSLVKRVAITVSAIKNYIGHLKQLLDDKNAVFRDFRLGKDLYYAKFRYDLVTSFTPEEIFNKSIRDKNFYQTRMYATASELWPKYCGNRERPADSLALIKTVIDSISLNHAKPSELLDVLTKQVHDLEHFIVEKNLFNYDTSFPLKVRLMPEFARGVTLASADFVPPYQKQGTTYYNVEDLTRFLPESAESSLREYNTYSIQYLSIHEAMPGHCLQGIYNNKRSPDIIKSVFENGTMVEGWAAYAETMMFESGWGNHAPEMKLMHDKWKLRELCNVILDYGIHCLGYSKEDVTNLLEKDAFQTKAQIEEKYHRAMVSQVQLCSYYSGASEIFALREDYKKKMGDRFSLKDFHEQFLSYGSAPVKYIREMMMK